MVNAPSLWLASWMAQNWFGLGCGDGFWPALGLDRHIRSVRAFLLIPGSKSKFFSKSIHVISKEAFR
jgi:hypothetical protein